jgi:hypothetical protein
MHAIGRDRARREPRWTLAACVALLIGLVAQPGETAWSSHTLNWTDQSANEDGFLVERRRDAREPFVGIATVGSDARSFVDAGLDEAVPFCYRVRAFNRAGLSAPSNEACAAVAAPFPVAPPPSPGAVSPTPPGAVSPSASPISVGLVVRPLVVHPGAAVQFSVLATNLGPPALVDVHFGVVLPPHLGALAPVECPGGPTDVVLVFEAGFAGTDLACLSTTFGRGAPLFPAVPISGGLLEPGHQPVLSYPWPGELPAGLYTFVLGVTRAGGGPSGEWLVLVGQAVIAVPEV